MSGVDVLAVLDATANECGLGPRDKLREARAAVAELMEAARAAEFHLSRRYLAPTTIDAADYTVEMEHDLRTLSAAIAKATGGAA